MSDDDILWQVVFLDRDNSTQTVEGLFKTEEEACRKRDELTKKRKYDNSFDYYPLDNDWEYYVKCVTRREVMDARRKQYEELMAAARERFWNHCDEHFESCCRESLKWLAERIKNMSDEEIRQLFKEEQALYAPWRNFYGASIILAYIVFEKHRTLSLVGQFARKSLCGTIYKDIRHFESYEALLGWIGKFDDAVSEFVEKMREERFDEYEKLLKNIKL